MNKPADFLRRVNTLVEQAQGAGFELIESRDIPYGRLLRFQQGARTEAVLNCYHGKKGFRTVVGGKAKDALASALGLPGTTGGGSGGRPLSGRGSAVAAASDDPFDLGSHRWGGDESGKGDYFGPLCVAVYGADADEIAFLRELGVADSKRIVDRRIAELSGVLDQRGCSAVVTLPPGEYNAMYAERGNLNHLLAELYRKAVATLLREIEAPPVLLIDRFTSNEAALRGSLGLPRGTRLVTRPKGEQDPTVAAASILARAAFVEGLRDLELEYGHPFPAGAGRPVLTEGRRFVQSFGAAALEGVAKLHFKTTLQIS